MAIVDRIYFPFAVEKPVRYANASGYGRRIPTRYMVKHNNRLRRVYAACFGNACTCYIEQGKDWIVVEL
jgi:hypothetical protein